MTVSLFADEVCEGDLLPALTRGPLNRLHLTWMSVAINDPNPIHLDDEYARKAGFPSVINHGTFPLGFMGLALHHWAGQRNVRKFACRLLQPTFPGEVFTTSGKVVRTYAEGEQPLADVEMVVKSQQGTEVAVGRATVALLVRAGGS